MILVLMCRRVPVRYVVGVDGGGTSCRVAVADLRGRMLGAAMGGPANIRTDLPGAHSNIMTALAAAAAQAGLPPDGMTDVTAVLGLAGANVGDYAQCLAALLGFRDTLIVHDAIIAVQGALGARDGVVGIIGTGSAFVGRFAGRTRMIGGWGFQIGDLGSGARLGQRLLQESLLAFDGVRPASPLTGQILAAFDGDPRVMVEKLAQAAPGFYAGFVPMLVAAAEAADPVARAILQAGAKDVERMLDAVIIAGTQRICLLGGLAATYAARLGEGYRSLLTPALDDALDGAVMLAAARAQARDAADA
jgi:glucosamine kinase